MSINEIQDQIIEDFSMLENDDKYEYIIELGNKLKPLEERFKKEENIIKGCQSKVWMHSALEGGKVIYEADSDGKISKGLISILIKILSDNSPEEITNANLYFIEKIGMDQHLLSQNRSNGLASMVKQMKLHALAYKTKLENKA